MDQRLGSYFRVSMSSSAMNESRLHEKSVEELRKLLSDKDAYESYLHSIEEVKQLDTVSVVPFFLAGSLLIWEFWQLRNDLRKSNVNLARHNLGKESEMAELRNQCMIIRTTELATAQEKFSDAQRREKEILARSSPASILNKLQEAANAADDESESLHHKLLSGELEFPEFLQKYRQQRVLYHRRTLLRLAALAG
ncbi:vacuolar protein-sorting-associated protein 37 homolog 1 isoform X1 [Selaginella moellendorffii]|uniref:vacuolar protein-sorting-associated protein 37 homolog 1 isoform X1 n=1 Tax=Selaginella moellendorffii TaxID=88036 RepID=UPI000D1CF288|nr:vacuolar protein-sorting-associated protein 37 homolog 1 isoform X1 [Selaginella moellendorffii]|eukprot:XP_024533401.1 vacuolar protein-sorting-associated protein 37 homolog 1 isoform X1 [Selaginella moellendorffii]